MEHNPWCMCMDCMYSKLTDPYIKQLAKEWKEITPKIEKQLEELEQCEK